MNHDVFISYSSKNSTAAQAICHELEDNGIKCWMAPRDITGGKEYGDLIDYAILSCSVFLLIYSADSLASQWCKGELNVAFSEGKTIIPYRIDATPLKGAMRVILNQTHWIEAYPDYKTRFKELVETVAQTLGYAVIQNKPTELAPTSQATLDVTPKSAMATVRIETDLDCRILRFGKDIGLAQSDDIAEIKLPKGKHKLQFVGLESDADSYECLLSVEDLEYEDYIEVKLLDKYNARREKEATEKKAKRDAYLLNLPDDEFVKFKKDNKWGYKLKSTGEIVITCGYDEWELVGAGDFLEGLAKVKLNGKCGFIDKTGKEVIPLKYDWVVPFHEGLSWVKLNGKHGFIDKTGKEVIPLKYDDADLFYEGLARVKLNGKYGFIDKTGKEVSPLKYDYAYSFREGLARVKLNSKYGFIDKTGKEVIALKYDNAYDFREGLAAVVLGKVGFIDKNGNEVIPFKYTGAAASGFSEGLAAVRLNGKWGFIDKWNRNIIPFKYDDAKNFFEGTAKVVLNNKELTIDKNCAILDSRPCIFDRFCG